MAIKKASFFSTHTIYFDAGSVTKSVDDYASTISNSVNGATNTLTYMLYSWDYSSIDSDYPDILDEIESSTIISVSIQFWHNRSIGFLTLDALKYAGGNPFSQSAATIATRVTDTQLATYSIANNNQTQITLELDDIEDFYSDLLDDLTAKTQPTVVGLARDSSLVDNNGSLEVGGQTLTSGGAVWQSVSGDEVSSPPLLIIEYETDENPHPVFSMKYTTPNPSEEQDAPSESIGGYLSINDIFPFGYLAESISSSQTSISIDADSDLPESIGVASVGPEIFRYQSIDQDNNTLRQVVRGVAPFASFPAGFNAYQVSEKVFYLHNNDETGLNNLFNTIPASSLIQYRCICIVNEFTADDFSIKDITLGVSQNTNADVQVDIGIEIPLFDSHTGTTDSGTTTSVIVDSQFSEANGFETGYFDDAAIKILSGINEIVTVESFDDGEFILSDTVTGLTSAKNYVIYPAPSQTVANDSVGPSLNSGRFYGFLEDGGSNEVSLSEHGNIMQPYDCFYVWIKRTLTSNVKTSSDIGAVIMIRFNDNA